MLLNSLGLCLFFFVGAFASRISTRGQQLFDSSSAFDSSNFTNSTAFNELLQAIIGHNDTADTNVEAAVAAEHSELRLPSLLNKTCILKMFDHFQIASNESTDTRPHYADNGPDCNMAVVLQRLGTAVDRINATMGTNVRSFADCLRILWQFSLHQNASETNPAELSSQSNKTESHVAVTTDTTTTTTTLTTTSVIESSSTTSTTTDTTIQQLLFSPPPRPAIKSVELDVEHGWPRRENNEADNAAARLATTQNSTSNSTSNNNNVDYSTHSEPLRHSTTTTSTTIAASLLSTTDSIRPLTKQHKTPHHPHHSLVNMMQTTTIIMKTTVAATTTITTATNVSNLLTKGATMSTGHTSSFSATDAISMNGRNFTILNVTEFDPYSPLLLMDQQAKEIVLLSTAFATMLLCSCFLIFIVWFCCFTAFSEHKSLAHRRETERSIRESESNVNEFGMANLALPVDKNRHATKSGDDKDQLIVKNHQQQNKTQNKETHVDEQELNRTQRTRLIAKNIIQSRLKAAAPKPNACNSTISYQPYDLLETPLTPSVKKTRPHSLVNAAFVDDGEAEDGVTAKTSVNEYANFANITPRQEIQSVKYTEMIVDDDDEPRQRKHSAGNQYSSHPELSRRASSLKRPSAVTKKGPAAIHKAAKALSTRSLHHHHHHHRHTSSKLAKTREQAEKELYEYTLECRRRIDQLFATTSSSSSSLSPTASATTTPQLSADECVSDSFSDEKAPPPPPPAKHNTSFNSRHFSLFRPASFALNRVAPPPHAATKKSTMGAAERKSKSDRHKATVNQEGAVSSIRTRKVETEKIWNI